MTPADLRSALSLKLIHRTTDAAWLQSVADHPAVRPWLGEPACDFAELLGDPRHVALRAEHGAFVFLQLEPGLYEAHSLFLPGKGAEACRAVGEALRFMFAATDALHIVTRAPETNRAALSLARMAHLQPLFTRPNGWPGGVAVRCLELTAQRWAMTDPACLAEGECFHDALERAKAEVGSPLATHPDDEAHDRFAGAALLTARSGQVRKGVWLYNTFARLAGYAPVQVLSDIPAVIDVLDAIVRVGPAGLTFLETRHSHPEAA